MSEVNVSLILNIHDERVLIHRTLHSLAAAAQSSKTIGLTVELIMVLDRSGPALVRAMREYQSDDYIEIKVIEVDRGSLGPARNDGIAVARGRYIATCDADDLVSDNMITNMYFKARSAGPMAIVFPEYYVYFGGATFARKYYDLKKITPLVLLEYHPYGSRIFAERSIFSELKFHDMSANPPYAYEDWHFNTIAIAQGYNLLVAPETVIFYRKRADSLSSLARQRSLNLIPRSPLFEPETYQSVCESYKTLLDSFDEAKLSNFFDRDQIGRDASAFFGSAAYRRMVLQANQIEPAISLAAYRPNQFDFPHSEAVATGLLYLDLCGRLRSRSFTDIFLISNIKPGGSEQYIIQVMNAIADIQINSQILVICHDEKIYSEWTTKLPSEVTLIYLDELTKIHNEERNFLILHKILQSIGVDARVHIKTSSFIFNFFRRGLAAALTDKYVIYYRFCDERIIVDDTIITCSNKFDFISDNIQYIDMVVCDHSLLITLDRQRIGTEFEKWVCLPAYCEVKRLPTDPVAIVGASTGRFLWASRLVVQKFPILLIIISEILAREQPEIIIDIYGSAYGAADAIDPEIFQNCQNLNYLGPYDHFGAIDTSGYDGFIYTTMYDGLPNVVLEAMANGLPVIAPACDGLPDIVLDGITGFLTPYDADALMVAQSYCKYIRTLSSDNLLRIAMGRQCLDYIAQNRSKAVHRDRVGQIFGLTSTGLSDDRSDRAALCN